MANSDTFTVHLQWKLKYTFLPLAEKTLDFSSLCQDKECILSPLPPVDYTIILTSSGMSPISDSVNLGVWEIKKVKYIFIPNISLIPIDSNTWENNLTSASGYTFLWKMWKWKFLAYTGTAFGTSFWVIDSGGFTETLSFSEKNTSLSLDASSEFLLASIPHSESTDIYSFDWKKHIQVPFPLETILSVSDTSDWKIKTQDWVYMYDWEQVVENPRFTDFIDISPYERIWYIDRDDSKKIKLSNLSEGSSYFVFLNRQTGESKTLPTEERIRTCFFSLGLPRCESYDGHLFEMQIGNTSK